MDWSRLKNLRVSRGLSAQKLAEQVGVTAKHLYAIESGRYSPSLELLEKIAAALDVPMASMFLPDDASAQLVAEVSLRTFSPKMLEFLTRPQAEAYLQLAVGLAETGIAPDLLAELSHLLRQIAKESESPADIDH